MIIAIGGVQAVVHVITPTPKLNWLCSFGEGGVRRQGVGVISGLGLTNFSRVAIGNQFCVDSDNSIHRTGTE